MMLRKWEAIPDFMRTPEVRQYWDILRKKRFQLFLKRFFDLLIALIMLILLLIPMIIIAILIKADSEGPVKGRDQVFCPPVCRVGKKAQGLSAADRQQIIDEGKKVLLDKAVLVLAFPARQKAVHVQHAALHKLQADRKQDGFGVRCKVGAEVRHPDSLAGQGLFDPFGKHAHFPSHSMPGADAPGMSCFICIDP